MVSSRRSFLIALSAAAAKNAWSAPILQPVVQNLTPDSASLVFLTPEELEFQVEWRSFVEGSTWRRAQMRQTWLVPPDARASSPLAKVAARLDRLPPGEKVEWRLVAAGSEWGSRGTLHVPQANRIDGDVLVVGDSGHYGPDQQAVLRQMMAGPEAAFLLHTGDLAYPIASFDALRAHYFEAFAPLMASIPFYPCLGNHDTPESQGATVISTHELPESMGVNPEHVGRYYSFQRGPAHFIVLDSNEPLLEAHDQNRMLRWLRAELMRSRAFWRIVMFHHTPYPAGIHANDRLSALAREEILPILEEFEVPLVLCGHEHLYKRTATPRQGTSGTVVITSGGGGGGLYPATLTEPNVVARSVHHFVRLRFTGSELIVQAVDLEGTVFDAFSLAPPPSIRNVAWEPGSAIHVEGSHLALPGVSDSVTVSLNRQSLEAARWSGTSIELPFNEPAPPSGELLIRTRNGQRQFTIDPCQI